MDTWQLFLTKHFVPNCNLLRVFLQKKMNFLGETIFVLFLQSFDQNCLSLVLEYSSTNFKGNIYEIKLNNWFNSVISTDSTVIHVVSSKQGYSFNQTTYKFSLQLNLFRASNKLEMDYSKSWPNQTYTKFVQKFKDRHNLLFVRVPDTKVSTKKVDFEEIKKDINWILNDDKDYRIVYKFRKSINKNLFLTSEHILHTPFTQNAVLLILYFQSFPNNGGFTVLLHSKCYFSQTWSNGLSLNSAIHPSTINLSKIFKTCPKTFQNKFFKVICPDIYFKLFFRQSKFVKGGWYLSHGIFGYAINTLMQKFNFTIKLSLSPAYGSFDPDTGKWSGTVGALIRKDVDIGLSIFQSYERYRYISLSSPLTYVGLTFTAPIPYQQYSWRSIYRPLEPSVWLTVFVCMVVTLVTLYVIQNLESYATKGKHVVGSFIPEILRLFVEQPPVNLIRQSSQYSTKAMLSFWLLFNLIIITCYRSTLVSLLTYPVIPKPLKTFEDVAKSDPIEYTVILHTDKTDAKYDLFRFSNNSLIRSIYNRLSFMARSANCLKEVIREMENDVQNVCIIWSNSIDFAISTAFKQYKSPPFIQSEDSISISNVAFAFSKDSPYRKLFDEDISMFFAMGLTNKWTSLTNYITKVEQMNYEKTNGTSLEFILNIIDEDGQVKFQHLVGVFYVMALGLCGSVFWSVKEYIWQSEEKIKLGGQDKCKSWSNNIH